MDNAVDYPQYWTTTKPKEFAFTKLYSKDSVVGVRKDGSEVKWRIQWSKDYEDGRTRLTESEALELLDWVDITESHPDHIARVGIDWFWSEPENKWQIMEERHSKSTNRQFFEVTRGLGRTRCLRKDIPPVIPTKEHSVIAAGSIPFQGRGKYKLANGQIVNLCKNRHCLQSDNVRDNIGGTYTWGWCSDGTIGGLGPREFCEKLFLVEFLGNDVVAEKPVVSERDDKMTKAVAFSVAKIAGNLVLRAAKYWVAEPTYNVAARIGNSIRYVTWFAAITAAVGYYNYPEKTTEVIKSALPKVEIKVERPELFK